MYWIQYAPASCRQWSKETLVFKSLVCFCLLSWTLLSVFSLFSPKKLQAMSSGCGSWWYGMYYGRCCVLNLWPGICAPWHYKYWTVVSCLVTTITINLFCFKDRGDQNILKSKVTLLYYYMEIKASSCFHSVFLKSHCLYNYFNIQYLIKVKLLFSALVITIISCVITDYHNLADEVVWDVPIKEGFITTTTKITHCQSREAWGTDPGSMRYGSVPLAWEARDMDPYP